MNKIIFINRYFFPDHSATSQMLSDLAFGLVENSGNKEIHVVTCQQRYDNPLANLPRYELINNVHIHRVKTTQFGRQNLIGRAGDYLSFYLSSAITLFQLTKKGDVLIAKTDPPLISVIAAIISKLKKAKLINWIQDLFPEVAAELGVKLANGFIFKVSRKIRNLALHQASANVAIGDLMAEKIHKEGIPKEKINVINNWADETNIQLISHENNSLRKVWGLDGKFVVGYSGNLGRSHDFTAILAAATSLKEITDIVFLFIGGGAQLDDIKMECLDRKLDNVMFKPYQLREDLAESLSVSDIHLISLKPELEGLIVPSKLYGILAVGRPVIFIGSVDGEISKTIEKNNCGWTVNPDSAGQLTIVIENYRRMDKKDTEARRIQSICREKYTKTIAVSQWQEILQKI